MVDVPDHFYMEVSKRHEKPEAEVEKKEQWPDNMPETRMLYYEDPQMDHFEAKVVAIINGGIVLDKTAFYPEGGGQEWDLGVLDGHKVTKVIKVKTCILHYIDGPAPAVGKTVKGSLDQREACPAHAAPYRSAHHQRLRPQPVRQPRLAGRCAQGRGGGPSGPDPL